MKKTLHKNKYKENVKIVNFLLFSSAEKFCRKLILLIFSILILFSHFSF